MLTKKLPLILFLCLIVVNIFIFFPSFYHVARADHLLYLFETAEINSLGDLINYSFSYTRTRILQTGDAAYFRPLFYVGLSLERYFFKYNFFYWQVIGLLVHLIVVGLLMKLLHRINPSKYMPVLFSLFFSLLYLSSDMVIWHHINMYMICFILILLALLRLIPILNNDKGSQKSLWMIVLYLTGASFINEFGLIASFIIMLSLFFINSRREKFLKSPFLLLIPAVVYFYVSIMDFVLRFPLKALFDAGAGVLSTNFVSIAGYFLSVLLASILIPFLPAFFLIFPTGRSAISFFVGDGFWGLWSQNKLLISANCILILMVLALIILLIKNRKKILNVFQPDREKLENKMFVVSTALAFGYMGVLVFSRGTEEFLGFLSHSLYHFYPICLFLTIMSYCLFSRISRSLASNQNVFKALVIIIVCFGTVLNSIRLFELNVKGKEQFSLWRNYVAQVDDFVETHKHEPDFSFDFEDRQHYQNLAKGNPANPFHSTTEYGTVTDYLFQPYVNIKNPKYYFKFIEGSNF